MNTSVIIISYNRKQYLQQTLTELAAQLQKGDEVVIVDDGSTDGTQAMVENRFSLLDVNYIKVKHHKGYKLSTRINRGIEAAKYDMVVRLDADCIPKEGWLTGYKKVFAQDRLICGGIWYEDETGEVRGLDHRRTKWLQKIRQVAPRLYNLWEQTSEVLHPSFCFGGNICFSKKVALKVGGMDTNLEFGWGVEDALFADIMMLHGVQIFYMPRIAVIHQWHPATGNYRHPQLYQRNLKLWVEKSKGIGSKPRPKIFPLDKE